MIKLERQYDLFNNNDIKFSGTTHLQDIDIEENVIKEWQQKIINHQSPFFRFEDKKVNQPSLFESNSEQLTKLLIP